MGRLGETLRERRMAVGVSLEQVQSATHIRATLIKALEEGDYSRLPNPGYVRGYISSYARYLELDPLPLLAMYKSETGSGRYHELNLPAVDEAVAPRHQQHAVPGATAAIVVVVIAVISLAIWGVARLFSGPEPTLPEPVPVTEPTSTTPATTPEADTGTQTDADSEVVEPTDAASELQPFSLEVVVSESGASWVEITVDDKPAYAGTLTGGQSKTYEVAESAKVLVGRPSAVTVLRDGKKVKMPASDDTPTLELEAQPPQ